MHSRAIALPTLLAVVFGVGAVSLTTGCTKKEKPAAKKSDPPAPTPAMNAPKEPRPMKRDMAPARRAADRRAAAGDAMGRPAAPTKPAMTPGGIGGLLGAGPRPTPSGKAHAVKLEKPKTVGMRYRLVNKGHRKTRLTVGGKVVPKQTMHFTWHYEAEVTVKAVNATGRATKETHKVVRFEITQAGKTRQGAPKGGTIEAFVKGGKEEFTINGQPAPDMVDDVLEAVISIANRKDKITADEIFAPKGPVQVGAIWAINKAKLIASLTKGAFKKAALKPTLADVTGRASLVAYKPMGGVPSIVVAAEARVQNIAPHMGPIKPKKGIITMKVKGWGPADLTVFGGGKTLRMRMHVEGEMTQGGNTTQLVMRFEQQASDTATLLK